MPDTPKEGVQLDGNSDEGAGDFYTVQVPKGTYRDEEAAAKGHAEASRTIGKLSQELDVERKEGAKLTEILEKLSEKVTAKPEEVLPDPKVQIEAFVEKAASALDGEDSKEGVRMILEAVSNWQGQSEAQQAKARTSAIKEVAEQLGQSVAEVKRTLASQDPDMLAHGEAATKLAEQAGVELSAENRDMFLSIAKAQAPETDQPERHGLPGGGPTTSVVEKEQRSKLSEDEKKLIGYNDLSKEQQAQFDKEHAEASE